MNAGKKELPKIGRIVAEHGPVGLVLRIIEPVVMAGISDTYWLELGLLVSRTGEPWWDFCATVVDAEPVAGHPHAHALSIYRVTAAGEFRYLHHEDS